MFTARCYRHKLYRVVLAVIILINVYILFTANSNQENIFDNLPVSVDGKIDWHDYKMIADEASRRGPGENGSAYTLSDPLEIKSNQEGLDIEGIGTVVSANISSSRSLPDLRLEQCKTRKYLKNLPKASVIIVFYDEPWSLILRCLHSILNRTPQKLLREIILVNDKSFTNDTFFENYVKTQFSRKVKMFVNDVRKGLAVSRVEGAQKAKGEVIVFIDSHLEVSTNWLPPLLEVIKLNPKAASVPLINFINPKTFEYEFVGHGFRGCFDWEMVHHWLPKFKEDQLIPENPHKIPVMSGEALAIRKDFFFELNGYDEGFLIQNAENFELSFKIWLCDGQILQCPCSHVAHVSRKRTNSRPVFRMVWPYDYKTRNIKRVVDVWMDDYKQFVYDAVPGRYAIDAGDLTKQFELKKKLNCKPFKYFMQEVAPDVLDRYIIDDRGNFASGAIISDADPKFCVTVFKSISDIPLRLTNCSRNNVHPRRKHRFTLTWNRSIKYSGPGYKCIERDSILKIERCHFEFGRQLWKYELNTHQIIQPGGGHNQCLTSDLEKMILMTANCDATDIRQKFTWGYTNTSALLNWEFFGVKLPDNYTDVHL